MILGRVVGEVVATQKRPQFEGAKLLLVQPETPEGTPTGTTLLAIDSVGAGRGELVIAVLEGRAAGEALARNLSPLDAARGAPSGAERAPVDAAIVGIVDRVDVEAD